MQYLLAKLRCWATGHIWCYHHQGPPVSNWGGPWYVCVRCTGWSNNLWSRPLITKRDHGV
jgi:hypothetical protein